MAQNLKEFKGKVAVVTGASKGIGAQIAKAFGAAGASVVVNYATGREGAEQTVAEIVKADGKAIAVQADLAKPADIKRLFAETKTAFGALDILVNNAGIFKFEPLEAVTEAEIQRQFATNVTGVILAAQEAAKYFGPAGGNIINVGSVVTINPPPGSVVYASTKAAVDTITRVLAVELAGRKIRVNALNPGPVNTEGSRAAGIVGSDFEKQMVAGTPLGRMGLPTDIAPVALFLASDAAAWITGETLYVSGGLR